METTQINPDNQIIDPNNTNPDANNPGPITLDRTVGTVAYQVFQSYLFKLGMGLIVSAGFITAVVLTGMPLAIIALPCIYLVIQGVLYFKPIIFEVSLLYAISHNKNWRDEIDENILLGGLPLDHQLDDLCKEKVGAVLSLVEDHELETALVTPITHEQWESKKITHKQFATSDFRIVPIEIFKEAVEWMHDQIHLGNKVLIHCKAGKSRSASVVMAYMLKYGLTNNQFKDFNEAHDFLKAKRPEVSINSSQEEIIVNYSRT